MCKDCIDFCNFVFVYDYIERQIKKYNNLITSEMEQITELQTIKKIKSMNVKNFKPRKYNSKNKKHNELFKKFDNMYLNRDKYEFSQDMLDKRIHYLEKYKNKLNDLVKQLKIVKNIFKVVDPQYKLCPELKRYQYDYQTKTNIE